MVRDNRYDSAYLFGAICPNRVVGAAIIMPGVNAEAMADHLAEISTQEEGSVRSHAAPMPCWSATVREGIRPAADGAVADVVEKRGGVISGLFNEP